MLEFSTYDVFTTAPYAGNPLAIVRGAEGLSTAQMQTMAAEFNLSETIFVRPPNDPAHTAEVRIFFPTAEIPFAGHPTVGCAIHLAEAAMGPGDWETEITLEEQAGLVPVRVWRQAGVTRAEFRAPVLPEKQAPEPSPEQCAAALGLAPGDIGLPGFAPSVWQGGPNFIYIPIASRDALTRARVIEPGHGALCDMAGSNGLYLFTPAEGGYHARMFAPRDGIAEDPATGSASAIFAGPLHAAGQLAEGSTPIALVQGQDMGRRSEIAMRIEADARGPAAIYVSGSAVAISRGQITPPAG